jgi:hypothetical protein
MAADARRGFGSDWMEVVGWSVVLARSVLVTRRARRIAFVLQFQRMRIVAIGTANSLVIHPALDERSVHINFVFDLTIIEIRARLQRFEIEVVAVLFARPEFGVQNAASTVARRARLQLRFGILPF